MTRPTFKQNNQAQPSLFPFDFGGLIATDHPVRLVDQVMEGLDITSILATYSGGGTSSYHPRMMPKVLVYAYLNNIYSSRKIAKALKENINFIWLSGQQFPDFRTINWSRGKKLKTQIDDIFKQVVLLLQGEGFVTLEEVFTDGTKIESVANRYTFVWKKSIEKHKERLEAKIDAILKGIDQSIREDLDSIDKKEGTGESTAMDPGRLHEKLKEINQRLSGDKPIAKEVKKSIKELTEKSLPKLMEYEQHLRILDGRNSYSKTGHQATFMRMKDDHMKNGQLKPAYNVQLSTESNFITNYTAHQYPGDTTTYKGHMGSFNNKYNRYPKRAIADAGYGGLENYDYMESHEIENFVKFNYFHKEQTKKFKTDISRVENLYYNAEDDYFICPMGQKMLPVSIGTRETRTGYNYLVTIYQACNCSNCPLRGACHKQKGNRKIEINKKLMNHKRKARENLTSEEGKILRGRRSSEVEQTFGQLKWNKKFNRFLLKGLQKVNIEIGLLALAHNFQKLHILLICNDLRLKIGLLHLIEQNLWFIISIKTRKYNNKQQIAEASQKIKTFHPANPEIKKAA